MRSSQPLSLLALFVATLLPAPALAWGARGHDEICEIASRLVREPALREFFATRSHLLGHLCNVPDISWKSLSFELRKDGDPSHYVNPEKLGKTPSTLPLDFRKVENALDASGDRIGHSAGSLWWRADQFFRLAVAAGKRAATTPPPATRNQEQEWKHPFNAAVYEMLVTMGLMGHFVGDASMPLHNNIDHDGKAAGHPGIHSFYEDSAVATYPLSIIGDVYSRAIASRLNYKKGSVLERMRRLSVRAAADTPAMIKADVVTQDGNSVKRPPVAESAARFKPLIYRELADSAAQLAVFWDEIYREAGRPDLKAYRSYRYPFQPEYIAPDYLSPGALK